MEKRQTTQVLYFYGDRADQIRLASEHQEHDIKNWFTRSIAGTSDRSLIIPQTGSGTNIRVIKAGELPGATRSLFTEPADAIITNQPDLCIALSTRDTLPIFLHDTTHNVIAVIHATWQGVRDEIIIKTILEMGRSFGSSPQSIQCYIGPSARAACLHNEVDKEFISSSDDPKWERAIFHVPEKDQYYFDTVFMVQMQLFKINFPMNNWDDRGYCTVCGDQWVSAQKSNNQYTALSGILLL